MTNLETLLYGVKHIAENHGFKPILDWEEDGQLAICGNNIPTLMDVKMLCADLGIDDDFIETNEFGIDIYIPLDWYEEKSNKEYIGLSFWKKCESY